MYIELPELLVDSQGFEVSSEEREEGDVDTQTSLSSLGVPHTVHSLLTARSVVLPIHVIVIINSFFCSMYVLAYLVFLVFLSTRFITIIIVITFTINIINNNITIIVVVIVV